MGLRGSGFETILGFLSNVVDDLHPLLDLVMLGGSGSELSVSKFPTPRGAIELQSKFPNMPGIIYTLKYVYTCV